MAQAIGRPQVPMTPSEIESALIEGGPGSRAVVGIDRRRGYGHRFNAVYDGQQVWTVDGQSGWISGWPPDMGDVTNWDAAIFPGGG